jgi:predicted nucleic acid-binding protein
MVTRAGSSAFVDTNVLVYATVAEAPHHGEARAALRSCSSRNTALWISRQIIREYLAVMSRPQAFSAPLSRVALVDRMIDFEARFRIAESGTEVARRLGGLLRTHDFGGRQVHDANIVATMLAYGIPLLLTFNRSDFDRFLDVIEILEP